MLPICSPVREQSLFLFFWSEDMVQNWTAMIDLGEKMKFSLVNENSWKAVLKLCWSSVNWQPSGAISRGFGGEAICFCICISAFTLFNLISSPSGSIIKSSVLYIFVKHHFWTAICISDNITKYVFQISTA